jgi:hypothetical protein
VPAARGSLLVRRIKEMGKRGVSVWDVPVQEARVYQTK